ncbi:hypothetical protein AAFN47_15340 [Hoeflea sp. CAU 1731]
MDGLDMAEIAERCGYTSVPAISRGFADTYGFGREDGGDGVPGPDRRLARG